jgi:hypothetical protein
MKKSLISFSNDNNSVFPATKAVHIFGGIMLIKETFKGNILR